MGKLVLHLSDGSTRDVYLCMERMTIGRRPDNDLSLPFPAVSGAHAAVITVLSDSFLEDLGSTNGTLVNGKSVTKHFLRDRDHVDIGGQNLVYYVEDNALPDPLPPELLQAENGTAGAARRDASENDTTRGRNRNANATADAGAASERTSPFRFVISDPDASELAGADAPGTAQSIDTEQEAVSGLVVRVMTGPSGGREIPLVDDVFTLGRVGVCVAQIRRVGNNLRLIAVEGPEAPRYKDGDVNPEGIAVLPGDTFAVAGTELALIRKQP
jgi:hypothetical protein